MDNTPAHSRRITGSNNAAVSARLTAIEERLDEIIRRLDETKTLLMTLNRVQPSQRLTPEDSDR